MKRRDFLQGLGAAGLLAALPTSRGYATPINADRARRFAEAMTRHPWLLGYRSAFASEFAAEPDEIAIEGRIPESLSGTFYRNGVGNHDIGGQRYGHWFDGHGLVHAFDIRDGRIRHRGRILETPRYQAEQAAGRPLYDGFGSRAENGEPIGNPNEINQANTHMMSLDGRLMALWEGGAPTEIDPESLSFRQFVTFSRETAAAPFSAHTRRDPDGSVWSIGYAGYAGKLLIYHLAPDGTLKRLHVLDVDPTPMLHDFLITERHIVLIMPPWLYDRSAGGSFMDRHQWQPERGGRALILDKNDLSRVAEIGLPSFWAFHYANAWEDAAGIIRFDFARYPDPSLTTTGFRDVMDGRPPRGSGARYVQARIDVARGEWREEVVLSDTIAEFPRIPEHQSGQRHGHTLLCLADTATANAHPGFGATGIWHPESGNLDSFAHAPAEMVEEGILVRAGDGSDWVLQTVLDFARAETALKIFPAARIAAGPVAIARLPYALPLGLHGIFVTDS